MELNWFERLCQLLPVLSRRSLSGLEADLDRLTLELRSAGYPAHADILELGREPVRASREASARVWTVLGQLEEGLPAPLRTRVGAVREQLPHRPLTDFTTPRRRDSLYGALQMELFRLTKALPTLGADDAAKVATEMLARKIPRERCAEEDFRPLVAELAALLDRADLPETLRAQVTRVHRWVSAPQIYFL